MAAISVRRVAASASFEYAGRTARKAIERKTGNHVKDGEGDIDDAEPNQHRKLR